MWVRGIVPIPEPPPGLAKATDPYEAARWPGVVLSWRWTDGRRGEWSALVEYRRPNGLAYHHWLPDTLLRRREVVDLDLRTFAA